VLKARGRSADEVGALIYETVKKMYSSRLGATIRLFSPIQQKLFGNQAARRLASVSQQHRYPNDFVCVFIEGGENFDYGFDYLECGICKFFHAQQADDFAQYMCRLDYLYAEAMGTLNFRHYIGQGG
jgi:hypothetical protein